MRSLRQMISLIVGSLFAALFLGISNPAEAATTVGRNFRFTASGNDTLKIVLHETNVFPNGAYAEIISGSTWALNQGDSQIVNGRWTWAGPLNSFGGFPTSPSPVEVQLGVYRAQ
jgi:hypothetical protein